MRRTTTLDVRRPEGLMGPLYLVGAGRDLHTSSDGAAQVLSRASCTAEVDYLDGRTLQELVADPDRPSLQGVLGAPVASGFRAAVARCDPLLPDEAPPLAQLLDDFPILTLISGHAFRAGLEAEGRPVPVVRARPAFGRNNCAGFVDGGSVMREADQGGWPIATGPPAVSLGGADPLSWHVIETLPPHSMRRARRMDVYLDGFAHVDVLFRDSYADGDGDETVIHEYTVAVDIDMSEGTIVSCVAVPRVLPWVECPGAVASAGRLAGVPLSGLRQYVRTHLSGTSTCTHLNDALRTLVDVPHLLSAIT